MIQSASLCKGLVSKCLGNFECKVVKSFFFFFLYQVFNALMSLNLINRFVVKELITFDSGDESPNSPIIFSYIADAALV